MSIRLNKAIRELNIGLQTAVEYLDTRKELGEIKEDPNFKLSDDQFKALEKEFKKDQQIKDNAAKIFPKKQKDKVHTKKTVNHKAENLLQQDNKPKFKPVGKIDLDQFNKPAAKPDADKKEKKETETAVKNSNEKKVETDRKSVV